VYVVKKKPLPVARERKKISLSMKDVD